jgi:hypothetical protein
MNYESNIRFADDEHKAFYLEKAQLLKPDAYLSSLIYTLGVCYDTRRHFRSIYDIRQRRVNPDVVREPWQTGSSLKVTRLAFQLFTDTTPTAFLDGAENIDECKRYSVSDIFSCSYAPFFIQAINLRYPQYLNMGRLE